MAEIGFAYFLIFLIAYFYQFKGQVTIQKLVLVIANRLLFVVSIGFSLSVVAKMILLQPAWMPKGDVWGLNKTTLFVDVIIASFFLLLSILFILPFFTRNLKASAVLGAFLFSQFLSNYFPSLFLERIVFLFYLGDYLPSFNPISFTRIIGRNVMFFGLWYLLFSWFKNKMKPKEEIISIEEHLIH